MSYTLPSQLLNVDRVPFASGGAGDVYRGTLNDSIVCVKCIRAYVKDGPQKAMKVCWRHCHFPHSLLLTKSIGFLPRGCNVEAVNPPKYPTLSGCHHHPPPACLKLDAWWELARIYQEEC